MTIPDAHEDVVWYPTGEHPTVPDGCLALGLPTPNDGAHGARIPTPLAPYRWMTRESSTIGVWLISPATSGTHSAKLQVHSSSC